MRRRGLRSWIRQQRRLEILIRFRHPLLRRTPPGRVILEHLGLAPHYPGYRRLALPLLEDDGLAAGPAGLEENLAPQVAEPSAMVSPLVAEESDAPLAASAGAGVPRNVAPASGPAAPAEAMIDRPRRPLPANVTVPTPAREQGPAKPRQVPPAGSESVSSSPARGASDYAERRATVQPPPLAAGAAGPQQPAGSPRQPGLPSESPTEPPGPVRPVPHAPVATPPRASEPEPTAAPAGARLPDAGEPESTTRGKVRKPPELDRLVEAAQSRADLESGADRVGAEAAREEPDLRGGIAAREPGEIVSPTQAQTPAVAEEHSTALPEAPRVAEQRQARRPAPRSLPSAPEPEAAKPPPPRSGNRAAAQAAPAAADLFGRTTDRPVSEWRRLLFEATAEPPVPGRPPRRPTRPKPSAPAAPPEPVLEKTRRFLRPLVGVDPNSVRVHRGVAVRQATEAAGADALTVGEEVAFPATHDERTPEGLGLLAHELTHVARRRDPRFVPPIARGSRALPGLAGRPAGGAELSSGLSRAEPASNEEALARQVEGLVRSEARAVGHQASPTVQAGAVDAAPSWRPPVPVRQEPARSEPVEAEGQGPPWGNLPAPWEPLPMVERESPASFGAPSGSNGSTAPAPVHRAAADRSVDESPAPSTAAAPAAGPEPPPDLDTLARQVYDVLKRRLAAERRREA